MTRAWRHLLLLTVVMAALIIALIIVGLVYEDSQIVGLFCFLIGQIVFVIGVVTCLTYDNSDGKRVWTMPVFDAIARVCRKLGKRIAGVFMDRGEK